MNSTTPKYVYVSLFVCRIIAFIVTGIHILAIQSGMLNIPDQIREAPGGLRHALQKIWFARLLKKMVSCWIRSPLRRHALKLVSFDFPLPTGKGLIYVTCHTPWKRLMTNWFYENHFALVVDTGRSIQRKARLKNHRKGHNELAHLIRHLKNGGQAIIAADVFNKSNDEPAEILGKAGNLSLLPVRLARIAGVPLMSAIPKILDNGIHVYAGPCYEAPLQFEEMAPLMKKLLGYFEQEIKTDPSIWSYFVNDSLSQFHEKRIE